MRYLLVTIGTTPVTLDPADQAVTVTPTGMLSDGSVTSITGAWEIDVASRTEAEAIAVRTAATYGQQVELRAIEQPGKQPGDE